MATARNIAEEKVLSCAVKVNALLDLIQKTYQLKNDARLCAFLQVTPPVISKLRHARYGLSADMIIRIHEITGWAIADIKKKLGLKSVEVK